VIPSWGGVGGREVRRQAVEEYQKAEVMAELPLGSSSHLLGLIRECDDSTSVMLMDTDRLKI